MIHVAGPSKQRSHLPVQAHKSAASALPVTATSTGNTLQRMIGNHGMMRLAQSQARTPTPDQQNQPGVAGIGLTPSAPADRIMRLPAEPYVSQINVDLTSKQNVSLDWAGTPPSSVRSTFRCSTGKGYGDPGDPPGICTRGCCTPGSNPCASPNDQRGATGSCCTPVGDFVIQSKDAAHAVEGGTIPFWMYFHRARAIAIHEYSPVSGEPLSHGCVRLDSVNAEMLFNNSYENVTRVHVSGAATPACPTASGVACTTSASNTSPEAGGEQTRLASSESETEEVDRGV